MPGNTGGGPQHFTFFLIHCVRDEGYARPVSPSFTGVVAKSAAKRRACVAFALT
jgi:hypothetical protein